MWWVFNCHLKIWDRHTDFCLIVWWKIIKSFATSKYGSTSCRVFKQGVQNWRDFCLKINLPKRDYWILRIGVMGRCHKVPKFDFQSQFSMSKIIGIFLNLGAHLIISIFKSLHFLKWSPIFDTSPLHQFSKFNNFLWVC